MDTKDNKYRSFIVLLYQYLWHVYATHNILLWINLVCKYTTTVSYTLSNDLVLVEQEVIILPKHQSSLPLGFVEFYILFSTQCLLDDCLSLCSSSFGYCNAIGIFFAFLQFPVSDYLLRIFKRFFGRMRQVVSSSKTTGINFYDKTERVKISPG